MKQFTLAGAIACLAACGFSSRTSQWSLLATHRVAEGLQPISAITAISFTERDHGWAVTPSVILETTNGGRSWTEKLEGGEKIFHSIAFINPTTGWVVGSQFKDGVSKPFVLNTVDGGKVWRGQSIEAPAGLQSLSFYDADNGWAAGSNVIVHTTDGGVTWHLQKGVEGIGKLMAIGCLSRQRAWAVGEEGTILHTEDGGQTWNVQDAGTTEALYRVRFYGERGWIVGSQSTLLRTTDGGLSWKLLRAGYGKVLTDIYVAGQSGWITGSNGTLLHTNDGGESWQQGDSPTSEDLFCLFFISTQQGWAGGDKRTVLGFSG
jgi:photosystem II stability/assembly factor-like uncharacterized protein